MTQSESSNDPIVLTPESLRRLSAEEKLASLDRSFRISGTAEEFASRVGEYQPYQVDFLLFCFMRTPEGIPPQVLIRMLKSDLDIVRSSACRCIGYVSVVSNEFIEAVLECARREGATRNVETMLCHALLALQRGTKQADGPRP